MIRINLLPHREMRRERRRKDFVALGVGTLVAACGVAIVVAFTIQGSVDAQLERNRFIEAENAKLDEQIKEIALLRQEIDALKARQQAVETLQSDRTMPVHVLDELVRHTPDGIQLKQIKSDDRKVTLVGLAQSNERVSNLLRNLAHETPYLERPELLEIKAVTLGKPDQKDAKDARRAYEFSLNVLIKSPAASETPARMANTNAPVTTANASR